MINSRKYTLHIREGQNWDKFGDFLNKAFSGSGFEIKLYSDKDVREIGDFCSVYGKVEPFTLEEIFPKDNIYISKNYIMLPVEQADALTKALELHLSMPSIVPYTEAYPVKHSLYSRLKDVTVKLLSLVKFLRK